MPVSIQQRGPSINVIEAMVNAVAIRVALRYGAGALGQREWHASDVES